MSLASTLSTIADKFRSGVPYNDNLVVRLADSFAAIGAQFGLVTAPAPTAKTADATLTIAQLLAGLTTVTSASAVAITLPLGTDAEAGVSMDADQGFTWSIINLGSASGAVTMTAATGHTYVGNATVAISTSARFLTRRVSADTFVTYRIS